MVAIDALWMARLKREQLLDVLNGDGPPLRPITAQEVIELSPPPGEVIAIWRTRSASDRTPLPQVIVGDGDTLQDMMAWSATYLRGLGPMTAHTRILTPGQFRAAVQQDTAINWWHLAAGAVGLVLGEVLMHTKRSMSIDEASLVACRGTLSFVLMRAAALDIPRHDFDTLPELWQRFRTQSGQMPTTIPAQTIAEVSRVLADRESEGDLGVSGWSLARRWFRSLLSKNGPTAVAHEVASAFGPVVQDAGFGRMLEWTAEDRVKLFDAIAPTFINYSKRERPERAFAIALAAFLCRPGLPQQAALLSPFIANLPEGALWLGAMQAAAPMSETLVIGDGLGWRLARDLFQPADVFAAPQSDIAAAEMQVLMRSRVAPRLIRSLTKSTLEVELHPGVSALVRSFHAGMPEQPELPISSAESRSETGEPSQDLLHEAERLLENCLRLIRGVTTATRHDRTSGRRKRR